MLNKDIGSVKATIQSLSDSVVVSAVIEKMGPIEGVYRLYTWELSDIPYLTSIWGHTCLISYKEFDYCNRLIREINRHGLPESMRR